MAFEVFIKIGRNVISRGEVVAKDSLEAAKEAAFILGKKTILVRPAYSEVPPVTHTFKEIPTLV